MATEELDSKNCERERDKHHRCKVSLPQMSLIIVVKRRQERLITFALTVWFFLILLLDDAVTMKMDLLI